MPPRPPHFLPYQGSKRLLAPQILAVLGDRRFRRIYEPFAGSGAVTLAAAHRNLAEAFVLGDSLRPLADLWRQLLADPATLAQGYERLWHAQESDRDGHFLSIRAEFNQSASPSALLYLLARCAKNAPRFNQSGAFNQAEDRRRRGVHPARLTPQLMQVAALLQGRCEVRDGDFADQLRDAGPEDLAYLDPPYQGTSAGRDRRYHQGLDRERLIVELQHLINRKVPFLLSYDGRTGDRSYGEPLPATLGLRHLELHAGRSSQATLAGRTAETVESLYVSGGM
jgi:DNA adenine methylase